MNEPVLVEGDSSHGKNISQRGVSQETQYSTQYFSQKKSTSTTLKSLQWKHFIYRVKKYRLRSSANQASEWEMIQNERIQFTVNLSLVLRPLLENISMGRMEVESNQGETSPGCMDTVLVMKNRLL